MVLRGLAGGESGVKKNRKAVGPSEGKMKGVRDTIATPARSAMVSAPLMNMNTAHIRRSGKRLKRPTSRKRAASPRMTSGSSRCSLRWRGASATAASAQLGVEAPHVEEEPTVRREERRRGDRRRHRRGAVAAKEPVERRPHQPELDDDQRPYQRRHRGRQHGPLLEGPHHPTSIPTAKRSSPRS